MRQKSRKRWVRASSGVIPARIRVRPRHEGRLSMMITTSVPEHDEAGTAPPMVPAPSPPRPPVSRRPQAQLQPLVLPQPSQTKQLPAGRIFVPQFTHNGASAELPVSDSSSSVELCTVSGAVLARSATTS
jgi:hypothetical protein